jgi:hypothetical protein
VGQGQAAREGRRHVARPRRDRFERDGDGWIAAEGRELGERLRVAGDELVWAGYAFTRTQQPFKA